MTSAEVKSNTNQDLKALFNDNWKRAFNLRKTHSDLRTEFEALYNCFENIGQITTGEILGKKMIEKLKVPNQSNSVYTVFFALYNKPNTEKSLLSYMKQLRVLQPIANNTTGEEIFLTKEKPFDTFLDALYAVRNNVRHGKKEFSERSDKILILLSSLLFLLIVELHNVIFAEEMINIKKERMRMDERQRAWGGFRDIILVVIGLTIFGVFIVWIFTTSLDVTPKFCYNTNRGNSVINWVEWILCSAVFNVS